MLPSTSLRVWEIFGKTFFPVSGNFLRSGRTLTTGTVAAAERFGQQSGESFEIRVYDAPVVHGSRKSLWVSCSKFRGS